MRAVITFHSLDDGGSVLSFPPRAFARLVEALLRADIPVVEYAKLAEGRRGVTLTFDDGMRSVAEHALPVLRANGLKAHLFLTTASVGGSNRWPTQPAQAPTFGMLRWDEVQACASAGMHIEGHTRSHPDLRRLGAEVIAEECAAADEEIRRCTGRKPNLFAYPYGLVNAHVRSALAGRYQGCFSTRMGFLENPIDPLDIPRLDAYYLRPRWVHENFRAPQVRAYLTMRALIRRARGVR